MDVEKQSGDGNYMSNDTAHSLTWKDVTVTVQDRVTKESRDLISNVNGHVRAGEVMALMGPSGSGKTTLLNVLAGRHNSQGEILVNGSSVSTKVFQSLTSFVEQEDALTGSLTVRETLNFAARLSMPGFVSSETRQSRVSDLISSFGLEGQQDTLIGTPIRKGISGGQKRRVSVASQLITAPKILFLDEPTSGLDSTASLRVIRFLKNYAQKNQLIVIASIHQPSTTTFELFDKLLLLSNGKTCYDGPVSGVKAYFDGIGLNMPTMMNPAEYLLEITNVDFFDDPTAHERLSSIQNAWQARPVPTNDDIKPSGQREEAHQINNVKTASRGKNVMIPIILLQRLFIKSYRDVVAYGIRVAMYMGLAIMMGTVWLRLHGTQNDIQPFINAIFFGSAFMSFMAVAYVPAFLEDRATFAKERANGLYGPTSFMAANFFIGLPFLFITALIFAIITYWLVDFRSGASAFFIYVMWLFLDLVAAESLVVLVSSLFPNFIISLTLVAFANGLWMCVGGFLVPTKTLNVFWRYVFHYIDYQAYVFRGMLVNEFAERTYSCAPSAGAANGCTCSYSSPLADQCLIDGKAVLSYYNYPTGQLGKTVGIMIAIIAVYRALGLLVLYWRK